MHETLLFETLVPDPVGQRFDGVYLATVPVADVNQVVSSNQVFWRASRTLIIRFASDHRGMLVGDAVSESWSSCPNSSRCVEETATRSSTCISLSLRPDSESEA